jgi:hypothetical protein
VVAVVVDAPLHGDDLPGGVGCHGREAPVCGGIVVVDADARVVAAGAGAGDGRGVEVGPGGDGLEDGAFGAGVDSDLERGMG